MKEHYKLKNDLELKIYRKNDMQLHIMEKLGLVEPKEGDSYKKAFKYSSINKRKSNFL